MKCPFYKKNIMNLFSKVKCIQFQGLEAARLRLYLSVAAALCSQERVNINSMAACAAEDDCSLEWLNFLQAAQLSRIIILFFLI